jgi:hypothetical protein
MIYYIISENRYNFFNFILKIKDLFAYFSLFFVDYRTFLPRNFLPWKEKKNVHKYLLSWKENKLTTLV